MSNMHNGKPSVSVLWLVTFIYDSLGSNVQMLKSNESESTRQEAVVIQSTYCLCVCLE
jgi:hypothetical protein